MKGPFKVIDGRTLSAKHSQLLQPGAARKDAAGQTHFLPRFFYEIETWAQAKEQRLAANFTFAELMTVDCREADLLLMACPRFLIHSL